MPRKAKTDRRRGPAGAAVLQPRVSLAIQHATLKELARAGYRGMSMESVARRAGVGKAALYRRWPSKRAMIVALIADWGAEAAETPDTGALEGDIKLFLTATLKWFADPLNSGIFLALLAEAKRDPKLKAMLYSGLRERRQAAAEKILQRGITRGELSGDVDVQLALDLMAAPLFWRAVVTQGDTSGPYIRTMTSAFLRAIDATPGHSATSAIEREQTPM